MSLVVSSPLRRSILVLVETALLLVVFAAAIALRLGPTKLFTYEHLFAKAILTIIVIQLTLYYSDLYDDRALRSRTIFFLRLGQSFIASTLILSLAYYVFPELKVGRGILLIFLPMAAVQITLWHSLHLWLAGREALSETVLILGTGHTARKIAVEMLERTPLGYHVVGFLGEHPAEVERRLVNPSIIGTMGDLIPLVEKHHVNLIVVALDDRRGRMPVKELLECRMAGIRVEEAPSFFERLTGKILVSNLRPSWLVFSRGFSNPKTFANFKRAFELAASSLLLILTAPLFLLSALLIKLDSPGPVIYRQKRVGEYGKTFDLLKLRTMRANAEETTGPVWASSTDNPRITRIGRALRKLRLDEMAQLMNVLRGEMSFVGPRPERPHFVEKLGRVIPYYHERHNVKPGITGWAQVRFGYASTIEDAENKLQFDLYYIKNMSLLFDLTVLLQTLKVMLLGRGAR